MDPALSPTRTADEARLLAALERLLGRAMGINNPVYGRFAGLPPLPFASIGFAAYIFVASAVVASEYYRVGSDARFVSLTAWGLVYYTAVLFLTRTATIRSLDTVRRDILPYATPGFIASVAGDLERRNSALMRTIVPLGAAFLAWAASSVALYNEVPPLIGERFAPVRMFWSVVAFYLCFVAARGVVVGRFYEPFARHLAEAEHRFYVLGAADTPLVKGVASLGQQMLAFWAMIFLAILLIMLLGFEPLGDYRFAGQSPFLLFVVPTAGFASLGYGSLVYLRSEAAIRAALQRFAAAQAEVLQRRCNALLDPVEDRLPGDPEELQRMSDWHDRIVAGARYGNRLGIVLSLTLPFVMPLLSLIRAILGGG